MTDRPTGLGFNHEDRRGITIILDIRQGKCRRRSARTVIRTNNIKELRIVVLRESGAIALQESLWNLVEGVVENGTRWIGFVFAVLENLKRDNRGTGARGLWCSCGEDRVLFRRRGRRILCGFRTGRIRERLGRRRTGSNRDNRHRSATGNRANRNDRHGHYLFATVGTDTGKFRFVFGHGLVLCSYLLSVSLYSVFRGAWYGSRRRGGGHSNRRR